MPAPTPITTAHTQRTPQASKPRVEVSAWKTAWQTAHNTSDQAAPSSDADHPTHDRLTAKTNPNEAHGSNYPQDEDALNASASDQATTPLTPAAPRPAKAADKTDTHRDQPSPNPQALPVIAAITTPAPAPTTQSYSDDKAQVSAVGAQVPQQPDSLKDASPQVIAAQDEVGNNPTSSNTVQPAAQNTVAYKNGDVSQATPQAKAAGQLTPTIPAVANAQQTSQTAESAASKTASSQAGKTTVSSPVGKADASAPTRTPVASTSQILSVYKLNSAVPIADTNILVNQNNTGTDLKKLLGDGKTIQPLEGVNGVGNITAFSAVDKAAAPTQTVNLDNLNTAPAALSATISALHHAGQDAILLRLDPPNLGHLSIQLKMDSQGAVNVLFVPSTSDATQALQGSLSHLGAAMAQSGLTLGQANIGGQFSQSGGHNGQQGGQMPFRQTSGIKASSAAPPSVSGLSAYA